MTIRAEQLIETQQEEDWVVVKAADKENQVKEWTGQHMSYPHQSSDSLKYSDPFGFPLPPIGPDEYPALRALDIDPVYARASLLELVGIDNREREIREAARLQAELDMTLEALTVPHQDCDYCHLDLDSPHSSDTESSPESVFSACSGRSHATYRTRGNSSEPWVIAPAPCFTGSQVGELSPIASSPLENLLIEHPSMSVYLSVPPSSLPPSHPYISTHLAGDLQPASLAEVRESERDSESPADRGAAGPDQRTESTAIQPRHRSAHQAAIHGGVASPQQLLQNLHTAQRMQLSRDQRIISNQKCDRQNKVYTQGHTKASNRKNKIIRPSGFKSSRFSQRV